MVKYIVPIGPVEHLFKEEELEKAKELAISVKGKVLMEGTVWKGLPKKMEIVRKEIFPLTQAWQ